jgi:putative redox protein
MAAEIKVQLRQVSHAATAAVMGSHEVLIDRPAAKGGTDMGPMGGQLFLASVGGCFMSNLLAAVRARNAALSDLRTEVTGRLADSPARFESLELAVSAAGPDLAQLPRLVEIADRGCIMMNTLRGKLDVTVRVATPVSQSAT